MTGPFRRWTVSCVTATSLLGAGSLPAASLDPESNTDGFDPGVESYRINEARRLNEISRQLELNYRMLWDHGFNPASPPVRQPIGHESKQVAPNRWIYRPVYPEQPVYPEEVGPEFEEIGPKLLPSPRVTPNAPAPSVTSPQPLPPRGLSLPAPSDSVPGDRLLPKKPPAPPLPRGPREF